MVAGTGTRSWRKVSDKECQFWCGCCQQVSKISRTLQLEYKGDGTFTSDNQEAMKQRQVHDEYQQLIPLIYVGAQYINCPTKGTTFTSRLASVRNTQAH
jgi:hypothetical protein